MRKAPAPTKTQGADGEQLTFLPKPPLCPSMPTAYSRAWLALRDLSEGPLTQIDWLKMGRGWRLSAAFKELGYLGWPLQTEWVESPAWPKPIKRYFLQPEGVDLAAERLKVGAA